MEAARGRHHHAPSRDQTAPPEADGLDSAVLEEAFETIDEVEGLLAGVAEGAPPELVEPALVR